MDEERSAGPPTPHKTRAAVVAHVITQRTHPLRHIPLHHWRARVSCIFRVEEGHLGAHCLGVARGKPC